MRNFLLMLCLLCCCTSQGQVFFQKLFGNIAPAGLLAHTIYPTDDGYLVGGDKGLSFAYNYTAMFKFDTRGNIVWNKDYENTFDSGFSYYMMKTHDSSFVFVGMKNEIQSLLFLIKTDIDGDTIWTKTYGSSYDVGGFYIVEVHDGYLVTGSINNNGISMGNLLLKVDTSGNIIWSKSFSEFTAYDVVQTADSGFVYAGLSHSIGSYQKSLTKCDANGNFLWRRTYDIPSNIGSFFPFCLTNDGGFLIAAWTDSLGTSNDIILVKTDPDGNIEWSKSYGGSGSDVPAIVKVLPDGGYVVAGTTTSFGSTEDIILFKIDSNGNNLWSKIYGDALHNESCFSGGSLIEQTADSGFIIAAKYDTTGVGTGATDIYLIKTDKDGFSGCNEANVSLTIAPVFIPVTTDTLIVDTLSLSTGSLQIQVTSAGNLRTLCESIGIDEEIDFPVSISPNPTTGKFRISISNLELKMFNIYNSLGQKVMPGFFMNNPRKEIEIDISALPSGIYFVHGSHGEKIFSQKIIKL